VDHHQGRLYLPVATRWRRPTRRRWT